MTSVTISVYRCTGFLDPVFKYYVPQSFALCAYGYFDLDPTFSYKELLFLYPLE